MKECEALKIFSRHLDKWFICYDKEDFHKEWSSKWVVALQSRPWNNGVNAILFMSQNFITLLGSVLNISLGIFLSELKDEYSMHHYKHIIY